MPLVYVYPTGDGTITSGTTKTGATSYYDCVNDPAGHYDSATTKLTTAGSNATTTVLLTFDSPNIPAGATVHYIRLAYIGSSSTASHCRTALRANNTSYLTTAAQLTFDSARAYEHHTQTWATNPNSGAAWTPEDINGSGGSYPLQQFGIYYEPTYLDKAYDTVDLTQCYMAVNYTPASPSSPETVYPTGNGNVYTGQTLYGGSSYWGCTDDVAASPDNNTSRVTSVAGGVEYTLFTFDSPYIPDEATVTAVKIYFRAYGSNGTERMHSALVVNGTNYYTTATYVTLGTSYATFDQTFLTNPNTGSAWLAEDINGTGDHPLQQFGVYKEATGYQYLLTQCYMVVEYSLGDFTWSVCSGSGGLAAPAAWVG